MTPRRWWTYQLRWAYPVVLLSLLLACDGDPVTPNESLVTTPDGLLDAPQQLEIDGRTYELHPYLWRDFQPVSPPDGKPLIALIRLVEADSLAVPADVSLDYLWVINGDLTWATGFSDEDRPSQPDYQLEEIARDGPKWGPGIPVDVVARVRTGDQDSHKIIATKQMINRTD